MMESQAIRFAIAFFGLVCAGALVASSSLRAQENPPSTPEVCNPVAEAEKKSAQPEPEPEKKKDPISRSWVPIAGYNPTYRAFVGGGFFFQKHELNTALFGVVSQDAALKADFLFGERIGPRWRFQTTNELANGFEPVYGLGNQTRVEDRVDLELTKLESFNSFIYEISPTFTVGPLIELRVRRSEELPAGAKLAVSRRETRPAFGIFQQVDYRNIEGNPTFGWFEKLNLMVAPRMEVADPGDTFALADVDLRFFQQMADRVVFAVQLAGGISFGKPTYLYQFRLGGTDRLRGYLENRFRGTQYYIQQTEFRFPIWKMLGGAAFLEFGEATTDRFGRPSESHGIGLRIGLPPDYVSQVRLDLAFGSDQSGVFFDFGHAF